MDIFTIEGDLVKLVLNPDLYNLESVYSAAHQMMKTSYIYLDGDPEIEVVVYLSYKDDTMNTKEKLGELAKTFLNHLVDQAFHAVDSDKEKISKALLLKKSFEDVHIESYDDEPNSDP
ncbi:MAG: hypothetical protein ACLFTR_05630 [Candidatus Woesearchaeota archaeon]